MEEIRSYQDIDFIMNYKNEILIKAETYINTLTVRAITPADYMV